MNNCKEYFYFIINTICIFNHKHLEIEYRLNHAIFVVFKNIKINENFVVNDQKYEKL